MVLDPNRALRKIKHDCQGRRNVLLTRVKYSELNIFSSLKSVTTNKVYFYNLKTVVLTATIINEVYSDT